MTTIVITLAVLLILSFTIHILLLHFGTHIGKKGQKIVILENLFCIAEALTFLILSWMCVMFFQPDKRIYVFGTAVIGLILLVSGLIGIRGTLRETPEDLVTVCLSEIRIVPAGFHNQDRKLEGVVNGTKSWFMLRGADKALAKRIKDSGRNHVTVVYHSSNRRIESISL